MKFRMRWKNILNATWTADGQDASPFICTHWIYSCQRKTENGALAISFLTNVTFYSFIYVTVALKSCSR